MEKKYKLTDETEKTNGVVLHRIEAVRDFGNIKAGDKGGYVEAERNLSHDGNAWVSDDACVYGNACVCGDAWVYDDACVYGDACVFGNAWVYGNAEVCGNAWVYGDACVYGNACVYDNAKMWGNACVYGDACVYDHAWVYGKAKVWGDACVYGNARVYDNAKVWGNAQVYGVAKVYGNAEVCGDAMVKSVSDYIVFKNWWSSGRYFTWTRSDDMWRVGCFYGTRSELVEKAYKDSEVSGREYEHIVNYVESVKAEINSVEASKRDEG